LCPGARRDPHGKAAGNFGDAGCFSFYPTKNLGALGDGGMVTTSDAVLAERLRELRQYGWDKKYQVAGPETKQPADDLQAALLLAKLPHLDRWNDERRAIARRYANENRASAVECPRDFGSDNVAHLFVVRARIATASAASWSAGVVPDIHYPIPDHRSRPILLRAPPSCRKPSGWRRKSSRFHAFPRWRKRKSAGDRRCQRLVAMCYPEA